jgi:hypothetical protein
MRGDTFQEKEPEVRLLVNRLLLRAEFVIKSTAHLPLQIVP